MRLGFFGAGNMASALASSFKKLKRVDEIYYYSPSGHSAQSLADTVGGVAILNLNEMPLDLDWYFLCFKPQNLKNFEFHFKDSHKLVSLLAGTEIKTLKDKFPNVQIARLMPNTPTLINKGMNLLFCEDAIDHLDQKSIVDLLMNGGELVQVQSEHELDLLTPFTGSGPGIIFELAEYFEQALKDVAPAGINTRKLIAETFLGTAMLMSQEKKSFVELRDQVTSKKGVTYAALFSLRENETEKILKKAFKDAMMRLEEMKKEV